MKLANYLMPAVILLVLFYGIRKRVPIFDAFLDGAMDNMKLCVELLPTLLALMTAIGMLKASGALTLFTELLMPLMTWLGFPAECIPLALIRPVSGSGALAVYESILTDYGADSFPGMVASVLQGASETTVYTIGLYYGACGIRKGRYTLSCALLGDFTAFLCSCLFVKLFW